MKYPIWKSPPPAMVSYEPEVQFLMIDTGQVSEVGEEIAEYVVVHHDKDVDDERSSAVAIHIDCAEYVLKPFVDAILAKYGVPREQEPVGIHSAAGYGFHTKKVAGHGTTIEISRLGIAADGAGGIPPGTSSPAH